MDCGLMWPLGISTVFQRPLAVPLHSPNGRHLPDCDRDCERVFGLCHAKTLWSWWKLTVQLIFESFTETVQPIKVQLTFAGHAEAFQPMAAQLTFEICAVLIKKLAKKPQVIMWLKKSGISIVQYCLTRFPGEYQLSLELTSDNVWQWWGRLCFPEVF